MFSNNDSKIHIVIPHTTYVHCSPVQILQSNFPKPYRPPNYCSARKAFAGSRRRHVKDLQGVSEDRRPAARRLPLEEKRKHAVSFTSNPFPRARAFQHRQYVIAAGNLDCTSLW